MNKSQKQANSDILVEMEVPIYKGVSEGVASSLKDLGMKKERPWIGAVVFWFLLIAIIGGGLSLIVSSVLGNDNKIILSKTPATTTATNSIVDSNYAVGNSGPVNQTIIGQSRQPHIEATTTSASQLESDGFYHTTYQLTLWDGSQTVAPRTFHISGFFVRCLATKNVGLQLQPSTALINTIECLSKEPPPINEVLFQF